MSESIWWSTCSQMWILCFSSYFNHFSAHCSALNSKAFPQNVVKIRLCVPQEACVCSTANPWKTKRSWYTLWFWFTKVSMCTSLYIVLASCLLSSSTPPPSCRLHQEVQSGSGQRRVFTELPAASSSLHSHRSLLLTFTFVQRITFIFFSSQFEM